MANSLFKKNQTIKLIPEVVNQACTASIKETADDYIMVKTKNEVDGNICECFGTTKTGLIYFKSTITKTNDLYKIIIPKEHIIMQRREYSRIKFDQETQLKSKSKSFDISMLDLSAGGAQILSKNELKMSENYEISIKLHNESIIKAVFALKRQEKLKNGQYAVSGKFLQISHKDRITLIQYCFSRLMENTNK